MLSKIRNAKSRFIGVGLMLISILTISFSSHANNNVIVLKSGTGVYLELASTVYSDMMSQGDILDFIVRADVVVGDKVVIEKGSIAKGQVLKLSPRKAIGRAAQLVIAIKSVVAVDGTEVMLSNGNIHEEGDDKQTLSIVLGIFVCVLCLLIKGEEAVVEQGRAVQAMVAVDTNIKI